MGYGWVQLTAGLAPEGLLFALESLLGPVKFEGRCCYSTTVADQRAGLANNTTPAGPRRSWGGAARDINSKSGDLAGLSGTGWNDNEKKSKYRLDPDQMKSAQVGGGVSARLG